MTSSGASLETRAPEPAVDLAALIDYLAPAVPLQPGQNGPNGWHLLQWSPNDRVLGINTLAVLWRFRYDKRARDSLGQHFVSNASTPRSAARAHLGGRLVPDSEGRLQAAIGRLIAAIDSEIDSAVAAGFDPGMLANSSAASLLDQLARQLGIDQGARLQGPTRMAPVTLTAVGASQQARKSEVARYLTAIEDIDATREEHVDRFLEALGTWLEREEYPQRTIQGALNHHREQAVTTGTQLSRFFDFLGDEALSRVRSQAAVRIMETMADTAEERERSHPDRGQRRLVTYVRRATQLLEELGREGLRINASAEFGRQADFDLRSVVATSGFDGCLPVWPDWTTQMSEERPLPSDANGRGDVRRELSYRFRVNGRAPDSGLSAYENRLRRIEHAWLRLGQTDSEEPPQRVARSLAELIFLWAVIPTSDNDSDESALELAQHFARQLEADAQPAIVRALGELRARAEILDEITNALISLMQARGTVLTRSALGRSWTYYINVLREIVDLPRAAEKVDRPLRCSTLPSQEQIDFLANIRVTDQAYARALLSVRVTVELSEYSLQLSGEPAPLDLSRRLPEHLAQVVWRPYQANLKVEPPTWTPAEASDHIWLTPGRVEVQFSPKNVRWPPGRTGPKLPEALQVLAATRAALAVLVYVTLLRLFERAAGDQTSARLAVSMLRLQQEGPEADPFSGDTSIYAAAQAIELLLGRDADLRMQGVVLDGMNDRFKRRGAYAALFAGFPLRIEQPAGERPVIGIVSFAARPSNDHPDRPDLPNIQLILSRTYVAAPTDTPFRGYDVRCVASGTEIMDEPDSPLPQCVEVQIEQLRTQEGAQHIIVLEHRFGQRRSGNRAARTHLRRQDALLKYLATQYPDVTIYPLVRDTFSATRVRIRDINKEDAFEILRPGQHSDALSQQAQLSRAAFIPVYSLATLHVVGGADAYSEKPQSGFCTYFLRWDDLAPTEAVEQMRSNLLLSSSPMHAALIGALRSIHYLEAERSVGPSFVQPVLDPYDWMSPLNVGKVGEITVFDTSRSGHGSVTLSLTALLDIVSRVVHAYKTDERAPNPGTLR